VFVRSARSSLALIMCNFVFQLRVSTLSQRLTFDCAHGKKAGLDATSYTHLNTD
jgi:hypothetical protein